MNSTNDRDCALSEINNEIMKAIDCSTPRHEIRNNYTKLPNYILNTISYRKFFRRNWNRYRSPDDLSLYKLYDKLVNHQIWTFRNKSWNRKLSNLDVRSKPFWNISKILKKKW